MDEAIIVCNGPPEEELKSDGFAPKNNLTRSPPQALAKPTLSLQPNVITPPTKYSEPGDINKAPKKKDTKLAVVPMGIGAMGTVHEGPSKPDFKPAETSAGEAIIEFNMDPTLENILKAMQGVEEALSQNTLRSGQKAEARSKMAWLIKHAETLIEKVDDASAPQRKPEEEACHKEIMTELAEIKKAVKQTYAQAAQKAVAIDTHPAVHTGKTHPTCTTDHECEADLNQDKARNEQAKRDIVITARGASDDTKKKIENAEEEEITDSLQELIQQSASAAGIKVQGIRKLAKHVVRIRCHTESDAKQIRELNWDELLEGAAVMETEYGIVVHGVPKHKMTNIEEFMANIERLNGIKVKRVALLRKNTRSTESPTQSIIIFMGSPEEANKCINDAVIIGRRRHGANRYTPQCQIRQCFNCQVYGHKADVCKKKPVCGKCAQEHETRNCVSEELRCTNCKGVHTAWSHECPRRQEIAQKMEMRKSKIPTKFSC